MEHCFEWAKFLLVYNAAIDTGNGYGHNVHYYLPGYGLLSNHFMPITKRPRTKQLQDKREHSTNGQVYKIIDQTTTCPMSVTFLCYNETSCAVSCANRKGTCKPVTSFGGCSFLLHCGRGP